MSLFLTAVLLLQARQAFCIWPPPYKINLSHSEEFVIFETFGSDDVDSIYSDEDEMIKKSEIKRFGLDRDKDKYYRIHRMAMMRDTKAAPEVPRRKRVKWAENNYDKEESAPWMAGFFGPNDTLLRENSNVFYHNEMARIAAEARTDEVNRTRVFRKGRRTPSTDGDYDYGGFKAEYMADVRGAKKSGDTLDFVDVKDQETFQEAAKKIFTFGKTPRNCTKEEIRGIGLAAAECFWIDFRKTDTKKHRMTLVRRVKRIVLIWFCIYLVIAVPCWCQRGWCCCCFQCRFCKPRKRIDEVKKFIADNPPGTYHIDNQVVTYYPSHYEKYAHKRLEQALMKL